MQYSTSKHGMLKSLNQSGSEIKVLLAKGWVEIAVRNASLQRSVWLRETKARTTFRASSLRRRREKVCRLLRVSRAGRTIEPFDFRMFVSKFKSLMMAPFAFDTRGLNFETYNITLQIFRIDFVAKMGL